MAVQIVMVLVMVVVVSLRAWPITVSDSSEIPASSDIFLRKCGDSLEREVASNQSIQVFFNATDSTSDCEILLRLFVEDNGLAKYGFRVFGHLHLNQDDCSSSSLLLHDNDDETDEAAVSKTFCNSGPVSYRTVEDVIIFSYKQRGGLQGMAGSWQGASVTVAPELVCGGAVHKNSLLAIHHYNFKAPYVCNWSLMPGEGQVTKVTFTDFHLTPKRRKKCTSEVVRLIPGDMNKYCGNELLHQTKTLYGEELISLRVTRASTRFQCTVEYVQDRRHVDHLPGETTNYA